MARRSCSLVIFAVLQMLHSIALDGAESGPKLARLPNVVFIIADDLGYGDLGCYGQKRIKTPRLDLLAAEGIRFTQHYAGNAVCAPSRCVLMTGRHPGHAFIRDNREVQPEGQTPLPTGTVTIPALLQNQGYTTGGFGKWGLGFPGSSGDPLNQGFDQFFGYNCQRAAHNYYPTYLWDNDRRVTLNNKPFAAHQRMPSGADTNNPASYSVFEGNDYAPDLIAAQARAFIRSNAARPFFLFFPTTVPHLALQVPEESLQGYDFPEQPYLGQKNYLPHRRPRAAYAGMISRLDREVGRFVDLVRELGLERDTLFVFTSDNGPLYEGLGGTDSDFFKSAGELNGRKGSLFEGGIRVPLIVRWKGKIKAGTVADRVTGFEDWLPTLVELATGKAPSLSGLDGISFAPTLLGQAQPERPFLYREFPAYGGWQSVRMGRWKAVVDNLEKQRGKGLPVKPKLFDLVSDPGESIDLADQHPDIVARCQEIMHSEHTYSREFPFPALDGPRGRQGE